MHDYVLSNKNNKHSIGTFKVRLNSSVTSPNLVYSLLPLMNLACLFPDLSNKYAF